MRVREANVRENTIADILWHENSSMTGHYSVAQLDELVAALELIADEPGRANKTLQMLQLEAKKQVVAGAKSLKSPLRQEKRARPNRSNPLFDWRARQDLNPRPPGS
jgi:hypothetical protein